MTIIKRNHKRIEFDREGRLTVYPSLHNVQEKSMLKRIIKKLLLKLK